MTTRIICVGNRLAPGDDAGPRVFDRLAQTPLPPGVEAIEGGLMGLDMLGLMEGAERIIFVDAVAGFAPGGGVKVMDALETGGELSAGYGHGGGLSFLLRVLPAVWEGVPPEVLLVGIERPADEQSVARAADVCLGLAGKGNEHEFLA